MSQNEDLSFKPLDDWTFMTERELDRGGVEVLERDKLTGKYHSRMSTLDYKLDVHNHQRARHLGDSTAPRLFPINLLVGRIQEPQRYIRV
ncbi:hypothetical protein ABOM_007269 [Aspergillus bombycis]|uniref:Uncharacterized protein n=1 Tax=Aspergillus bombycis TaxID=109264 RepID=A0A1F7ZX58_9EURO|nr:hypothetical protein ABOM_007269 [Aspergillus bombycis]OGM44062.1 hypothetical protein ABOM_007269 [Aspergillus bombycis]